MAFLRAEGLVVYYPSGGGGGKAILKRLRSFLNHPSLHTHFILVFLETTPPPPPITQQKQKLYNHINTAGSPLGVSLGQAYQERGRERGKWHSIPADWLKKDRYLSFILSENKAFLLRHMQIERLFPRSFLFSYFLFPLFFLSSEKGPFDFICFPRISTQLHFSSCTRYASKSSLISDW